jgi:hypothetical protein
MIWLLSGRMQLDNGRMKLDRGRRLVVAAAVLVFPYSTYYY